MPWPEQFKRKTVNRPVSNVASVLVGTGDMGPVPWAGYNLPNYADIRSEVGSKNVIFLNIMTARSGKDAEAGLKEFFLPEYQQLVRDWGSVATNWNVYMHEIIGHGSGTPDPGLEDDPRNLIGRSFSALEEARADLVALYFIPDPKLVEIGAFPEGKQDEVVLAAYAKYFQGFLTLYSRFHGGTVKEAHWKGRQLILRYLLNGGDQGEGDYGLSIVQVGGKYFVKIGDPVKVRAGIGTLLRRIQVIKSLGQKDEAEALISRFGGTYDEAIAADITARSRSIGVSKQSAFVFPRLDAILDRDGTITDVKVVHDEDLTMQQLRYTRLQEGRDLE
jgi:dipeptidyl-peptidase-3